MAVHDLVHRLSDVDDTTILLTSHDALAAPVILRRMARRESGSAVAERREKAMARIG